MDLEVILALDAILIYVILIFVVLCSYEYYLDVQHYMPYNEINFIKIISKKPFKLVHEDTNQILGTFKEFSLDKFFKVIDTDNGEFKLSDEQLDDLLKGKYDFMF